MVIQINPKAILQFQVGIFSSCSYSCNQLSSRSFKKAMERCLESVLKCNSSYKLSPSVKFQFSMSPWPHNSSGFMYHNFAQVPSFLYSFPADSSHYPKHFICQQHPGNSFMISSACIIIIDFHTHLPYQLGIFLRPERLLFTCLVCIIQQSMHSY